MKLTLRPVCLKTAALALALAFGVSAYAQSPREEVVHAHVLLKTANHDYGGHRLKAMHELEEAGHALHLKMGGNPPEHERQWKSDEQLTEARRLLRDARDKLEKEDRDRVAARLDTAIDEIDRALRAK